MAWAAGLEARQARLALRFPRPAPRARASRKGRRSPVERHNGWPVAAHAGEATPEGLPRRLATDQGDAARVRADWRTSGLEHVGDPQAVLVREETGLLTQGPNAVGVQRQDAGTAGRVETGQLGVCLA